MANYSIGTATQYANLPLLPALWTVSGGIRLDNNISLTTGARVEFDGLKYDEAVYPTTRELLNGTPDMVSVRLLGNASVITSGGNVTVSPNTVSTNSYTSYVVTGVSVGNVSRIFNNLSSAAMSRCISKQFRIKNASGTVVYKWLDQISDYKSTPPNGSIVGVLGWFKLTPDNVEVLDNRANGTLVHNALVATPPRMPVTVYILDAGQDVSMIQASYNGQPVTIDYGFLPKRSAQRKFGYGFGFQF